MVILLGMHRRLLTLLLFIFTTGIIPAQEPREENGFSFMISSYPLRYIYGPNVQLTALLPNNHQVTVHYQFHHRDFFSVRQSDDVLGLSAIPRLIRADGYTVYASYLFPTGMSQTWLGPKFGMKRIDGFMPEEEGYPDLIHQINHYALVNWVYRTRNHGFFLELYAQAGVVLIQRAESEFINNQLDSYKEYPGYLLPHILVGFSLGLGV